MIRGLSMNFLEETEMYTSARSGDLEIQGEHEYEQRLNKLRPPAQ